MFHRHGDRTPWFNLHDEQKSASLWVPRVSQFYTSFDKETLRPNVDNIHSWQNISSKLRGITLAYKDDNWNRSSPIVFHSIHEHDEKELCELSTGDNTENPFLGQLTDKGCKQLEIVGKLLRERYVNDMEYLPKEYDPITTNLHYHSTNTARTIQSADCVLQELYPMENRKNSVKIPLHVDVGLTYLSPYRIKSRFCEKLKCKADENEHAMLKTLDERFDELTDIVLSHYKTSAKELPLAPHAIAFDSICCRLNHDIKDKPNEFTMDYLTEFGKYLTKIECASMSLDRESLRLTWGPVLYKMMQIMKQIDYNQCSEGYMNISSCHDDSILAVLCSLYGETIHNIDLEWPDYASYVIFELWKDGQNNDDKYVRVLYNGKPLNIFDGKDRIDLKSLEKRWQDIMIDEASYFNGACAC